MKRFLAFLLLCLLPLAAEPASGPELAPAQALAHRVEELKAALVSSNPESVNTAVQRVEEMRLRYAVLDVMPLVNAMALWARERGLEGRPELGLKALDVVDNWAPGHPTLLGVRVTLLRQQGPVGWFKGLPDLLRLTRMRLEHPANRWLWLLQHAASVRLFATLLLWGWALALLLRYRNVLRDLWEEPMRARSLSPVGRALAGALLLTLPVLLRLDPTYVAFWWLWLMGPFLHAGEVRLTALVVLFQLVHPAAAFMEPLAKSPPPLSLQALQVQPQIKPLDPAVLGAFPEGDRRFLEGWRQLQQRDWAAAEATFMSLESTHPDKGPVMNNLGVARFQLGQREQAEKDFLQAATLSSGKVEILLNQSVIHFCKLETELGTAKQEEARTADPILFAKLVSVAGEQKEASAFAMPLPDSPERIQALDGSHAHEGGNSPLGHPAFLVMALAPLVALGAIVARVRGSVHKAHPSQCIRCGEPFHITDSPNPEVCTQCHHLFTLKDGLHQESRKKKIDQVNGHQAATRRFHKVMVLLLPGCDLTFLGDTREGFVEWLLVCLAAGMVFATGRTVLYPGEVLADPVSTWLPLGMAFLALLMARSWMKLIPRGRRGA